MRCEEETFGNVLLMTIVGRIDLSNADAFEMALVSAISRAESAVVLDFSSIDYISSAGLRSLMIALRAGKAEGKALAIAALQPLVQEIFAISRFNLVVPLFESVQDALGTRAPHAL